MTDHAVIAPTTGNGQAEFGGFNFKDRARIVPHATDQSGAKGGLIATAGLLGDDRDDLPHGEAGVARDADCPKAINGQFGNGRQQCLNSFLRQTKLDHFFFYCRPADLIGLVKNYRNFC